MQRVLIIAYYWPPAGGPGVQRWLKFTKYLPDFGIEPIVYVPENPTYPIIDKSLVKEVPSKLKVLKKRIFEPYQWASVIGKSKTQTLSSGIIQDTAKQGMAERSLLFIRGNFFIPDARKYWVKPSVKFLSEYLQKQAIDQVITTGPPHSLHQIGYELQQKLPIQWVADFRDPWTGIGYHKKLKLTRWAQQQHERLENTIINAADAIITTSYGTQKAFQQKTTKPIHVVTNGFEPQHDQFVLDKHFSIAHIGSLLTDRNPQVLWEALQELLQEEEVLKKHLQLRFAGKISEEVLQHIEDANLTEYTEVLGYVPHDKAVALQHASQVLLLIEIDKPETREIIPGKVFEYLAANRPILAIGPKGWDVNTILKKVGGKSAFTYSDKTAIKTYIRKAFKSFLKGELSSNYENTHQFTRKALTAKLAAILKNS